MRSKKNGRTLSQRQLRVGEMIKQALGNIFMRGEAKLPNIETSNITVTEVRMSPDLKTAKAFVLPLGGKNANEIIDVLIQVFSVSGKLVKTLSSEIINSGFRDDSIVWDGFDDFGDKLGKGVYIYRVTLKSKNDGSKAEKFEKLVILQ